MYEFHIIGYAGYVKDGLAYYGDHPIGITVYACTTNDAINKAEEVLGEYISYSQRKIVVKEIPEW